MFNRLIGGWLPMLACLLYAADRLLRLAALRSFFRRAAPPPPLTWPTLTLIQPVTRASHDLRPALNSRATLSYPGAVQQLVICDVDDAPNQTLIRAMIEAGWHAELLLAAPDNGPIASKLQKIHTALPHATGQLLCFLDDDVRLPPDALPRLVCHLDVPGVGVAFGLARYVAWESIWSSLMSLFVNAWALPSYVPLLWLSEPYTITGHCFALRRDVFEALGGFNNMAQRVDDDHELARRVLAHGLRCVQTPLIYDVENRLATAQAYQAQLRRWFVMPRQNMLPQLNRHQRLATLVGSAGNLLPPATVLLALLVRRRDATLAAAGCLGLFLASYALIDQRYLGGVTPARRWALLPVTALLTPLHIALASATGEVVEWRGQRLRLLRGGGFETVES